MENERERRLSFPVSYFFFLLNQERTKEYFFLFLLHTYFDLSEGKGDRTSEEDSEEKK
jgi:hypothetical protein